MALDNRRTYLCYNNGDLIRDGFIPNFIEKDYDPVSLFNTNRLENPPTGVTYIVGKDENGEIISVREKKKLLPASKIRIEIDFSKVMRNATTFPFSPGSLAFTPLTGMIATPMLSPVGFGGITSGTTDITVHLLAAQTTINQSVTVTQEMLDTGILQFGTYPLSVFGIVKEHEDIIRTATLEELPEAILKYREEHPQAKISTNSQGETIAKTGIDFSNEEVDIIGKFSDGVWQGSRRKRISGATDSDGLYGGKALADVLFDDVIFDDQEQLFKGIVKDHRKFKFRADNFDANGGNYYPPAITGTVNVDATDKQMRISTDSLAVDDIIYITYSSCSSRNMRQNLVHKGSIAQGNSYGVSGFIGAIESKVDAFNYGIYKWKVPALPSWIDESRIDESVDDYYEDNDYKLTGTEYIKVKEDEREEKDFSEDASEIEGWRLTESILWRLLKKFFAADYRGILYYDNGKVYILYPRESIRDQDWFTNYLENLSFTKPTGNPDPNDPVDSDGNPKKTYTESDLEKNIEDNIDLSNQPGFLFDTSEIINSLLFDREKIHYYRPFANALKTVSKYADGTNDTGVGIPHLDLLPLICSSIDARETTKIINDEDVYYYEYDFSNFNISSCDFRNLGVDLEYYDLSYAFFNSTDAQPLKSYDCEVSFDLHSYNYFSTNYDASNGPGSWYSQGFLRDQVFEWRPSGSSIESYWKIETPYFCGEFTIYDRVYIERMGGPSLDNYSWIYVDTEPFVPHNISSDTNFNQRSLSVVFNDDNVHHGLCHDIFHEDFFEGELPSTDIDKTKNHNKEPYDHDKNLIIGQNRILGDTPSYSHGIPIVDDVAKVCRDINLAKQYWWTESMSNFGLNFRDEIPKAQILDGTYISYLDIKFNYWPGTPIEEIPFLQVPHPSISIDKYISFYFEGSDSSISNVRISELVYDGENYKMRIDFKYYNKGPLQFLGEFWKKARIIEVNARFSRGGDSSINALLNTDTYKIDSSQSAVVFDRMGRIMVFYSNEQTGNIDAAVSLDTGNHWLYHTNLIRLTSRETASFPFAIKDNDRNVIHLFYVLNDAFIMYKSFNSDWFILGDAFVEYNVPDTYLPGDYSDSQDPERDYWGEYSEYGVRLRRTPSYFIAGSYEEEYFKEQMKNVKDIEDYNESLSDDKVPMTQRFIFEGNEEEDLRDAYRGAAYTIYLSNTGILRLFLISNGKLSIKTSNSYPIWQYDIFEQIIHKDFVDDNLNKGFPEEISNIQVVRNDYDNTTTSVLYFHNRMLFLRHFSTDALLPWVDSKGNKQDEGIRRAIELTDVDTTVDPPKDRTTNVPIFLVGVIPDIIKNEIIDEIENEVRQEDSKLFISFPYTDPDEPNNKDKNKAMVNLFNEDFAIDTETQVYACTTAKGLIRIFYKDSFGNLESILVDSLISPTLEVMNVPRSFNG
jgi:hypothetical protein